MAKSKKEVTSVFKLMAPAGAATPAPPIGPVLGQNGVNPGQFITQFNEKTKAIKGKIVGCVVTVYKDRTFTFEIKQPPASILIKEAAKIEKGSGVPNKDKVGKLTKAQLEVIAKEKGKEMTGLSTDALVRTLAGTARSMGVTVEGI
ncbi:MAG: 50S ribosomal protein L11 [Phycisphaerales bacterium]|nr:50S ribosomal protein L11 [Phycisphaerales bacterium]